MKSHNTKEFADNEIFSLLKRHSNILIQFKVKKIGLFGFFARGDQKRHSDIDFLVEFHEPTFENFMDLLFSLEELFGRRVELITDGNLSPYLQPLVEKEIKWYEVTS